MGARPLRRVIQDKVEDRLSDAVLSHEFKNGDSVIVDVNQEKEIILRRTSKRNSLAKAMPLKEDMEKPEQMPA
jgi:ATP-dependent Clp protease ATP-binding subunit ClpC